MYTTSVAIGMIMFVFSSSQDMLPSFADLNLPDPAPNVRELEYKPPVDESIIPSDEAPQIYQHNGDAGLDQTFFMSGANLAGEVFVWGRDADNPEGRRWDAKTYLENDNYLAVTLPDRCPDSLFIVWVKNNAGWSRPFRLNTPQPWWCWPKEPIPGQELRIFGRDLARRPDRTTAADGDSSPSILGTIVELNVVRDAAVAYHSGSGSDGALFRRNHAYFWYPVSNSDASPVAFQIDRPDADVVIEDNVIEGIVGEMNPKSAWKSR